MTMHSFYTNMILILMLLFVTKLQAQSFNSSLKDEMKKELLKQVKPSMPNSSMIQSPNMVRKTTSSDDLLHLYKKYKSGSGGEEFDSQYKVNPNAITYNSKVPINQIEPGKVVPVYTGGHFVLVNPATNGLGLVKPSGIDLSGGRPKKISPKTRKLLELLFGITIEDANQLE